MASKKNKVEPAGGLEDVEGDLDLVDQELKAQEDKVKQQEQKVAEEKRKAEERKKQEAEKKAQEDKRKKEEQDRKKREEEEKKKANKQEDDQKKKAEDERKKAENDRKKAEDDRKKAEDDRKNAEKDVKKKEEQLEKDKKKAEQDQKKKEEDLEKKKRDLEAKNAKDAETRRARQQELEKDIGSRETAMVGAAAALETAKTKAKAEDEKREKEIDELKGQEKKFKDEEKKMKSERKKVAKERKGKTPSAATSCSMKMAKWSIVAFNGLFVLGGLALFGFGLYLRLDDGTRSLLGNADQADLQSDVSSTSPFFLMTYGIMGLGLFITAVCCLGLFGALKENDLLLFIFAIITLLLACGLLAMGIVPLASRQVLFVDTLSGFVTDLVQTDYGTSSSARTVMDWIQEQLKCCGSDGPNSWNSSTWVSSAANTNNVTQPDSCYADQSGRTGQFIDGCTKAIEEYADDYFLYIGIAMIVFAVILLVCVSCAFTFCSRIRKFRKYGHSADLLDLEAKHKKQTKDMAKLKKELEKLKKQQTV